jgi:hypothetical protein
MKNNIKAPQKKHRKVEYWSCNVEDHFHKSKDAAQKCINKARLLRKKYNDFPTSSYEVLLPALTEALVSDNKPSELDGIHGRKNRCTSINLLFYFKLYPAASPLIGELFADAPALIGEVNVNHLRNNSQYYVSKLPLLLALIFRRRSPTKTRHKADMRSFSGGMSAVCFAAPREVGEFESWTWDDNKVTCAECHKIISENS